MIFAAALSIGICAQAQEMIFDALSWSENDYSGTARTMGMGNAVTAVGGDPGTFIINPAGGAVSPYSQVEFTPGGSVSISQTSWSSGRQQKGPFKDSNAMFVFPNGGFSFNFDTGNTTGLVRWSFGFTANASNIYNNVYSGGGENPSSSFAAYLATYANDNRLPAADLKYYNTDYCCSAAYNAYVIDRLADYVEDWYIGTTENIDKYGGRYLAGSVNQSDRHKVTGTKMDYVMNFGFNISNIVYLGANLGITNLNYNLTDGINESAVNRSLFETGFREMSYSYWFKAVGTGVYGKFGIIATPIDGLRLGAAIQTPTELRITEFVQHSMTHDYDKHGITSSPQSSWIYKVVSPMRFNFGAAYTIANVALISVDYERADYGAMHYRENEFSDRAYFENLNSQIKGIQGEDRYRLRASNMVRAGIEVKPIPEFAIRAGYNFTSNGRQDRENLQSASFGLGYISKGSFYCDVAAKLMFMPSEEFKVYDDYSYLDYTGEQLVFNGPVMSGTSKLVNFVGTVGWRF